MGLLLTHLTEHAPDITLNTSATSLPARLCTAHSSTQQRPSLCCAPKCESAVTVTLYPTSCIAHPHRATPTAAAFTAGMCTHLSDGGFTLSSSQLPTVSVSVAVNECVEQLQQPAAAVVVVVSVVPVASAAVCF